MGLSIVQGEVPSDSLLVTYVDVPHPERWRHYVDCFTVTVAGSVTLRAFVRAFYTSRIFKMERWLLAVAAGAPSTDEEARELAEGRRETFAVWTVGARSEGQLLMCDRYGKTRSWFSVQSADGDRTVLRFGSAVVGGPGPAGSPPGECPTLRILGSCGASRRHSIRWLNSVLPSSRFKLLLGFHRLYSRLLLKAAARRCGVF